MKDPKKIERLVKDLNRALDSDVTVAQIARESGLSPNGIAKLAKTHRVYLHDRTYIHLTNWLRERKAKIAEQKRLAKIAAEAPKAPEVEPPKATLLPNLFHPPARSNPSSDRIVKAIEEGFASVVKAIEGVDTSVATLILTSIGDRPPARASSKANANPALLTGQPQAVHRTRVRKNAEKAAK